MPTERELIQRYKTTADSSQAAMVRFLGECFTEALLVREHVSSAALATHFAAKMTQDENAAELAAMIVVEYLKAWVEGEAEKIARARKSRFTEKRDGAEIFDAARVALRDQELEDARKKVEAWKVAEHARHSAWGGRVRGTGMPAVLEPCPFEA